MKKMLVLATSAMMLVACSEKPGYEITGTVNNPALEGKFVYLYPYGDAEAAPLDSAEVYIRMEMLRPLLLIAR